MSRKSKCGLIGPGNAGAQKMRLVQSPAGRMTA